ncbi:MAG: hypothetical protein KJ795_00660 [Gammaproteobacteria bacterium]|nr:hypothetical protein [Gammaproteobacteria bacterium]MBU1775946.1 hypothetical protein [Gammaproteobacteria bacterium]
MKGALNVELAGVVLTLRSMTGLLLTGEPTFPPPQADKTNPNSQNQTRIHLPEQNNQPADVGWCTKDNRKLLEEISLFEEITCRGHGKSGAQLFSTAY